MNDDWQVGDRALCISEMADASTGLPAGPIFPGMVEDVTRYVQALCACGEVHGLLGFVRFPGLVFDADCFVKLRDHTPDADDAEVIALLTGEPIPA